MIGSDGEAKLARACVVLVEPWEPGNVGASARAMKNLGSCDLRLVVSDRSHRPRLQRGDARRFATHAVEIVEQLRFFSTLEEAIEDCGAAYGFTARTGRSRRPLSNLFAATRRMAERLPGGRIALVFGTEERGLSDAHLAQTTELVRIPATGEHGVFNLSQSVLLGLWELARTVHQLENTPEPQQRRAPIASLQERSQLRQEYDNLLVLLAYGRDGPGSLKKRILRRLIGMFDRSGGERDDAAMLRGIAAAVRRAIPAEGPVGQEDSRHGT